MTQTECLWYNGELACYHLLDFEPNGLTKEQILLEARNSLRSSGITTDEEFEKARETLYLLDIDGLKRVNEIRTNKEQISKILDDLLKDIATMWKLDESDEWLQSVEKDFDEIKSML